MRVWALNWRQKLLLLEVLLVLCTYKVGLFVLPFSCFIRPDTAPVQETAVSEDRLKAVIWAITVVSRRVSPGFTCLVQALAAKWLLKNNHTTQLCVGVHKHVAAGFSAHAWLTYKGTIILGEQATPVFKPILEWQ